MALEALYWFSYLAPAWGGYLVYRAFVRAGKEATGKKILIVCLVIQAIAILGTIGRCSSAMS